MKQGNRKTSSRFEIFSSSNRSRKYIFINKGAFELGDSPLPPPWIFTKSFLLRRIISHTYQSTYNSIRNSGFQECFTINVNPDTIYLYTIDVKTQTRSISSLLMSKHGHNLSLYYRCQNTDTIYLFTVDVKTQTQSITLLLMSKHGHNLSLYY